MLSKMEGAIFDLDGTLVDSMWVWQKIDEDYLSARGIKMPKDLKSNIEYLSFEDTAKYFKANFNIEDSVETIMNEWNQMAYREYLENVPMKPNALKFLNTLKSCGVKIALATSNCYLLLETVLKKHGVYDLFDVIVTTEEAKKSKAFPDVFLLAAEKLKLAPENCVVFEDILPAIISAKSVGMKVVAIEEASTIATQDKIVQASDMYIGDYSELLLKLENVS
ncbi:HAD family hydrolase [Clostridium cellulovorans]|uniref:HAD-superfamily hydrolase, subfamily IA, variant 3 n=1 Tax=Clostridium cellulovorans (strain ATCC 35296 / DSM 3052 / OCM 3 / 743B) TaxID=573061 RepID=D9SKR3_CLOC7|nr:HAD family phosphatase [Clostridium cellulovorans]ADL53485.1 HAD-superfamily hydrolase, subfamily IA, variant 3 [Clostridium cellulovorans 743B]